MRSEVTQLQSSHEAAEVEISNLKAQLEEVMKERDDVKEEVRKLWVFQRELFYSNSSFARLSWNTCQLAVARAKRRPLSRQLPEALGPNPKTQS